MTDYIKREDAIKAFDPRQRQDWYTPWIVETLNDLPSADVEPVRHGYWQEDKITMRDWGGNVVTEKTLWRCSICGHEDSILTNYCPNCGAKMDGDADDQIDR